MPDPECARACREVVRWLKGWDACVFGTATPAPPAPCSAGSRFQPHGTQRAAHGASNGAPDAFGRPEHKVILIAGPPGERRGFDLCGALLACLEPTARWVLGRRSVLRLRPPQSHLPFLPVCLPACL